MKSQLYTTYNVSLISSTQRRLFHRMKAREFISYLTLFKLSFSSVRPYLNLSHKADGKQNLAKGSAFQYAWRAFVQTFNVGKETFTPRTAKHPIRHAPF